MTNPQNEPNSASKGPKQGSGSDRARIEFLARAYKNLGFMEQLLENIIKSGKTNVIKFICNDGEIFGPEVIIEKCEHLKKLSESNMQESKLKEIKMSKYKTCHVKAVIEFLLGYAVCPNNEVEDDFEIMDLARCWLIDDLLKEYYDMYCDKDTSLSHQIIALRYANEFHFSEFKNKLFVIVTDKLLTSRNDEYSKEDEEDLIKDIQSIPHEIITEIILQNYKMVNW